MEAEAAQKRLYYHSTNPYGDDLAEPSEKGEEAVTSAKDVTRQTEQEAAAAVVETVMAVQQPRAFVEVGETWPPEAAGHNDGLTLLDLVLDSRLDRMSSNKASAR